mgnify:CR=1 FL=1
MDIIDFVIGVTLMNAMPHIVASIFGLNMKGPFGSSGKQNALWALCNFLISIGLFVYVYGVGQLLQDKIYLGALTVLAVFLATLRLQRRFYSKETSEKK